MQYNCQNHRYHQNPETRKTWKTHELANPETPETIGITNTQTNDVSTVTHIVLTETLSDFCWRSSALEFIVYIGDFPYQSSALTSQQKHCFLWVREQRLCCCSNQAVFLVSRGKKKFWAKFERNSLLLRKTERKIPRIKTN